AGAEVRAHDPKAMGHARELYRDRDSVVFCDDPYDAARGADALVLVTEWRQFWAPDFERLYRDLANPLVV
ncbi:MAG: UDP-glucose 6-dehydrogenase, partial [Xanthomonadales bacterium]|nr:UDP-glucose 6-dehydrogenase [Xanthomonadales bacterium]NIX12164.1 UDP-glucose 6-dehydrogenase [Xanthomonadales bacterium]